MKKEADKVLQIWKDEPVFNIKNNNPYKISEQVKQFASLFTLGPFYYFILNFHDLSIDYVHETTESLLGISPEDFSMETLLAKLPEEELVSLQKKEAVATHFLSTEIDKEEVMDYKVVYFLKVYNAQGDLRTFLHQATTLTQSEEGNIQHTIGIQMDVTDLKIVKNDLISFISLNDKNKSYFNIDPEQLPYDYQSKIKSNSPLKTFLSNREIEIVKLLSKGFSSKQIGVKLFISTGTVSTHRKNIRKKTGIKSTAELISRSLMEGLF